MAKQFYCKECDDDSPFFSELGWSHNAMIVVGTSGQFCVRCGSPVELVDKPCDHVWKIVVTDQMKLFPYSDHGPIRRVCARCGHTQSGETTTVWRDI